VCVRESERVRERERERMRERERGREGGRDRLLFNCKYGMQFVLSCCRRPRA